MTIRSRISPWVTPYLTSDARLIRNRRREEKRRQNVGERHTVRYFHQTDDPYSALAAQFLAQFAERYDVVLEPVLVPRPPDWAAPERERLVVHSRKDAAQIASHLGLEFSDTGDQPNAALLAAAQQIHARSIDSACFAATASAVDAALWHHRIDELERIAAQVGKRPPYVTRTMLDRGNAQRDSLGHYLGATFHYGGEWYWGIDRLHFLEQRLYELGLYTGPKPFTPLCEPPALRLIAAGTPQPETPPLEFFVSLRSPYSYLAVERTIALAKHYGLVLRIRYVLPMVMRGLPVPAKKRGYITFDCKREANRLGLPFGKIADPLGRPVERGVAVLQHAIDEGRGSEFLTSFMRGVWAEGIDVDTNRGLRKVIERAGLEWTGALRALENSQWRDIAESNRSAMFAESIWGVPSFRFGSFATWGQDRLWLLESRIIEHLGQSDSQERRSTR
jgi:2-hydroxychromene-2-carboxylate isomerase